MAVAMRSRVAELAEGWRRRGHDLGFGVGIAQGYATLGRVGFEGRYDYAAIGTVTNVSARLSAAGRRRARSSSPSGSRREPATPSSPGRSGPVELRGITRPVEVFEVLGLDAARTAS